MHIKKYTVVFLIVLSFFTPVSSFFTKISNNQNYIHVGKVRALNTTVHNNTSDSLPITIVTTKSNTKKEWSSAYSVSAGKKLKVTAQLEEHIQSISMPSSYCATITTGKDSTLLVTINKKDEKKFNKITSTIDFEFDIGRDQNASRRSQKDFELSIAENNLFTKLVMNGLCPKKILSYLIDLYNQNKLTRHSPDQNHRIPLIIHHVWFGSPFPEQYQKWRTSWTKKHPNWIDILWVDNPENYTLGTLINSYEELVSIIANQQAGVYVVSCSLVFPIFHQDFFEKTNNLGERSDIFRLDILNRFGGLYVDTDFECIEPFDILNHTYDFYAGLAPLSMNKVQVANGLIASRPYHPILKAYQSEIRDSRELAHLGKIPGLFSGTPIVAATGPAPLTRAIILAHPKKEDRTIIFPPSTFYAHRLTMREFAKEGNQFPPQQFDCFPDNFALPIDSFAIHYWESSWNK